MTAYALDVAFNSATEPIHKTKNIYAMGFGFAKSPSGTWEERGQKVQTVNVGDTFYFSIFDVAPKSRQIPTVQRVVVTFFDPDNPSVEWGYAPLSVPGSNSNEKNPITLDLSRSVPILKQSSAGCNVTNAACWRRGPYLVTLPNRLPSLILDCTVKVTVRMNPSDPDSTKFFSVDPEMIVEGGG